MRRGATPPPRAAGARSGGGAGREGTPSLASVVPSADRVPVVDVRRPGADARVLRDLLDGRRVYKVDTAGRRDPEDEEREGARDEEQDAGEVEGEHVSGAPVVALGPAARLEGLGADEDDRREEEEGEEGEDRIAGERHVPLDPDVRRAGEVVVALDLEDVLAVGDRAQVRRGPARALGPMLAVLDPFVVADLEAEGVGVLVLHVDERALAEGVLVVDGRAQLDLEIRGVVRGGER